jgi:hypothetical protein
MHPPIEGAYDLVKKTSFRQLMQLIYHSQGVICIVTCLMHIAAAFNKPCVVIGGGREPWWWEAYNEENRLQNMRLGIPDWKPPVNDNFVPHRYMHTMGKLKCCMDKGCWRARVGKNGKLCFDQVMEHGVYLPRCLQMITPDMVVDEWKWYFDNGICKLDGSPLIVQMPAPVSLPEPEPEPPEPSREPVRVRSVFLAVYMNEQSPTPKMYAERMKQHAKDAGAEITIFYDGMDAELAAFCSKNDIPIHMAQEKPGRAELFKRMLYIMHADNLVWIEGNVTILRNDWLHALTHELNGSAKGLVRWSKVNQSQLELVRTAKWYRGLELVKFPFDLSVSKVYHFERGLFAAPAAILREMGWPDERVPDADLDVLLGEALRQNGVSLKNVGDVAEYA